MSISIRIDSRQVRGVMDRFRARFERIAAAKVSLRQEEQVAAAFANEGQPSSKWPRLWADTFVGNIAQKKQEKLTKARLGVEKALAKNAPNLQKASDRYAKAATQAVAATSYRKGGKVLQDNGHLAGSWHRIRPVFAFGHVICRIRSSEFYAQYHQDGFNTDGPNFIPLTLRARRNHTLGNNPLDEGLEEGVDYIIAWGGVSVPARPMIDYSDPVNLAQIKQDFTDAAVEAAGSK